MDRNPSLVIEEIVHLDVPDRINFNININIIVCDCVVMETQRKQVFRNDQIVRLKSSDGKIFDVPKAAAWQSGIIKNMAEDFGITKKPIPLLFLSSDILEKIIKYCKYHVDHPLPPQRSKENVDPWYVEFVNLDLPTLTQLGLAAMRLDIMTLFDLVCRTIAGEIVVLKTPGKAREILNMENDLTPQDLEAIKCQAPWVLGMHEEEQEEIGMHEVEQQEIGMHEVEQQEILVHEEHETSNKVDVSQSSDSHKESPLVDTQGKWQKVERKKGKKNRS